MYTKVLLLVFTVSASLCLIHGKGTQNRSQVADEATTRLHPTSFPQLPRNIVRALQTRRCTIPQAFSNSTPHNVISGEFMRRGQTDWAILCSKNRVSSILVFWGGSTKSVAEVAKAADRSFLQGIDDKGNIGFSRAIDVVDRYYILRQYKEYGGPKPPRSNHQGINDAFVEKASTVRYFHRGKWLELQGAD